MSQTQHNPRPAPDAPALMTIAQFCALVGMSRVTYYKLPKAQRPLIVRITPSMPRIRRADAGAWIAALPSQINGSV